MAEMELRFPEAREIGILMLSALGDAVHVLPVANALRRAYPDSRITWIVQPVPHRLVAGHPAVDDFVVFHRRRGVEAWRSYAELRERLSARRFDVLLALQVYFKAGLIAAMAPAAAKVGFDRARARDLNWLFTSHRIPPHPVQHVQDQYFEFLEYLGIDPAPVEWRIRLSEAERAAQAAFFGGLDRPAAAIVVGTSKPQKNWAPERYARVAAALESDFGLRPVIVGGPSAAEAAIARTIERTSGARVVNALGDDVRKLVWLLDAARVVVSPDTGPLHLARALDTPVVGLYGYTNPKRYGPYRRFTELVVDGYARHPGEDYPASMEHREGGMERVGVDAVLGKVELALRTTAAGRGTTG
ncbi:MAG TPA: glycosyltransferase family 9 protein [Longimicrobiales bacterium]|nr:glycosyltransferase family 9 protein [Longimicrobiales bacterium]